MKYREQIERHLLKLALREGKNTHMTHIEDLVILGGAEGIEQALDTFNSLFTEFKGETPKSERRVSIKIDGAPAVFVWNSFPGLRGPGLSMKGLFAKTPKAAYTEEEVIEVFGKDRQGNVRQDLVTKLTTLLKYIPQLNIPDGEIWQGDFLYDNASVKLQKIDDELFYTFHPNTIVYAVPVYSEIGERMEESEVGVVWHTVYTGDSVESATASFTAKAENLNNVPQVFSTDPYIKSIAGTVTMTAEETAAMDQKLVEAEALAEQLISMPNYENVVENEKFIESFFTVFQNATIRSGKRVLNPETFVTDFLTWATNKVQSAAEKKIAGLKTDRGRAAAEQKLQQDLQTIHETIEESEDVLILIVELIGLLTDIKEVFTHKMDALGAFQAYLQMKSGEFRATGQEGFAVSDIVGNVVKFVDRTEFSYANFSSDVAKGWENSRVTESRIRERGEIAALDSVEQALNQVDDIKYVAGTKGTIKDQAKFEKPYDLPAPPPGQTKPQYRVYVDRSSNRSDAADSVADTLQGKKDLEVTRTKAGTTPKVDVDVKGEEGPTVELFFKDEPGAQDSESTRQQEQGWMELMYEVCSAGSFADFETTFADVMERYPAFDESWRKSAMKGSNALAQWLGRGEWVFSHEKGMILPENEFNLHSFMGGPAFNVVKGAFGSSKDAWNPSDFYIHKKNSVYIEALQQEVAGFDATKDVEQATTQVRAINDLLLDAIKNKEIIGVSLKKVSGEGAVQEVGWFPSAEKEERVHSQYYDYIELTDVTFPFTLPTSFSKRGTRMPGQGKDTRLSLTCEKDGNITQARGQIRLFSGSPTNTCQIELQPTKSKARWGKVPATEKAGLLQDDVIVQQYTKMFGENPGRFFILQTPKERITWITDNKKYEAVAAKAKRLLSSLVKLKIIDSQVTATFDSFIEQISQIKHNLDPDFLQQYSQALQGIEWVAVLAAAEASADPKALTDNLNKMIFGAQKITPLAAPFIKLY